MRLVERRLARDGRSATEVYSERQTYGVSTRTVAHHGTCSGLTCSCDPIIVSDFRVNADIREDGATR